MRRRPAPSRPLIPRPCFSHDRYNLDVHYVGGTLHVGESVYWPVEMVGENALPPDPERFRPGLARGVAPSPGGHPAVAARVAPPPAPRPVLARRIGGRGVGVDRGAGPRHRRSQRRLPRCRAGRAGARPGAPPRGHRAVGARLAARRLPGPSIDGVGLMRRWWDRWLAGEQNSDRQRAGHAPLRWPVGDRPARSPSPAELPGRWCAIGRWPPVLRIAPPPPLYLEGDGAAGLGSLTGEPAASGDAATSTWAGPPDVGLCGALVLYSAPAAGRPADQRPG